MNENVLAAVATAGAKQQSSSLTGAGSSFVSKLVQTWTPQVDRDLGIKITYGPIGSGGGRLYFSRVWVGFRLGRAVEITTTRSSEHTGSGVGVGSSEAAVRRAYPSVTCSASGGFRRCRLGSGQPGTRATDFLIGHGLVLQVTISLLIIR